MTSMRAPDRSIKLIMGESSLHATSPLESQKHAAVHRAERENPGYKALMGVIWEGVMPDGAQVYQVDLWRDAPLQLPGGLGAIEEIDNPCPACDGGGCPMCADTGRAPLVATRDRRPVARPLGPGLVSLLESLPVCRVCGGDDTTCTACGGTGREPAEPIEPSADQERKWNELRPVANPVSIDLRGQPRDDTSREKLRELARLVQSGEMLPDQPPTTPKDVLHELMNVAFGAVEKRDPQLLLGMTLLAHMTHDERRTFLCTLFGCTWEGKIG